MIGKTIEYFDSEMQRQQGIVLDKIRCALKAKFESPIAIDFYLVRNLQSNKIEHYQCTKVLAVLD